MTKYISLKTVLAIHERSLEKYGGATGIRDFSAVEAALYRPRSGYYRDIIEEAAALMESFLINHPFVDGNKRTAFAVCYVFLTINNCTIKADSDWFYERMLSWIENKENRLQEITNDLRTCVTILSE